MLICSFYSQKLLSLKPSQAVTRIATHALKEMFIEVSTVRELGKHFLFSDKFSVLNLKD